MKYRVLFVCHGNICRSPMAEFVMKEILRRRGLEDFVEVESAALHTDEIGSDIHHGTRGVLREKAIPFAPRAAWLLTCEKAAKYNLVLGMDSYNMCDLRRLLGGESAKAHLLLDYAGRNGEAIADPWYTGDFDATWRDVLAGCEGLADHLEKMFR